MNEVSSQIMGLEQISVNILRKSEKMFYFFSIGSSVSDGNRLNSLELHVVLIQLYHEEQCTQFIDCKRAPLVFQLSCQILADMVVKLILNFILCGFKKIKFYLGKWFRNHARKAHIVHFLLFPSFSVLSPSQPPTE